MKFARLLVVFAVALLQQHAHGRDSSSLMSDTSNLIADATANQLYYHQSEEMLKNVQQESEAVLEIVEQCSVDLDKFLLEEGSPTFQDITLNIHRNGEPEGCGQVVGNLETFQSSLAKIDRSCHEMNKYDFEALLTDMIAQSLEKNDCSSIQNDDDPPGFRTFCDMGEEYTPILLDHNDLVKVDNHLPCHFHTREGVRVTSMKHLAELSAAAVKKQCSDDNNHDEQTCQADGAKIDLYAVPAGRLFMFAPKDVGEIFELPHVVVPNGEPVYLKVLSISPRVFDIYNFFTKEESSELVQRALKETSATHKMKRSTTGTAKNEVNSLRTSDNGFDTHGKTALQVKRRCFDVLGFDEYLEGHADGLQILRYNVSNAYTAHMDYMTSRPDEPFDYDSAHVGGNRYATILLYMSDLKEGDGGETVFPKALPPDVPESERVELDDAIAELRASNATKGILEEGSWEEKLTAQCRTRLAVRPNSARAVLFYSQLPDGRPDPMSKHGACPMINGEKWAANLWVWNTPREDFEGAPIKEEFRETYHEQKNSNRPKQLHAVFLNSGDNPEYNDATLYFDEGGYWGKLTPGARLAANTYEGHLWNVKVNDVIVKTWVIGADDQQKFVL